MTTSDFKNWLKSYGQAWEDKDSKKFAALFSEKANYHWTPFESPKAGRDGIKEAFENATSTQSEIKFGYDILSFENNRGICSWWCKFNRTTSGRLIKLDGIFVCEFENNNLCKVFREWWHKEGE